MANHIDPLAFQVLTLSQTHSTLNVGLLQHSDPYADMCSTSVFYCPPSRKLNAYHTETEDEQEFGDCFFMHLANLDAPIWRKINCNQPLVQHVFCQTYSNKTIQTHPIPKIHPDAESCLKLYIL